jgi:hypothetical protein
MPYHHPLASLPKRISLVSAAGGRGLRDAGWTSLPQKV